MLLPVERDHLKRLLALASTTPGYEDIAATYSVPDGEPAGPGKFEPLLNAGDVVRDTVFLNLGHIRIKTCGPRGEPLTPDESRYAESATARSNAFFLEMFIDGKWMQSMSVDRVTPPVFDYHSSDSVRVKVEFIAYANGPSWVPVKDEG